MNADKSKNDAEKQTDSLPVIEGELLEFSTASRLAQFSDEEETVVPGVQKQVNAPPLSPAVNRKPQLTKIEVPLAAKDKGQKATQKSFLQYLVLPAIFLTVTLLGGLRFGEADNAFLFLKPSLLCLIFASILLLLFSRAGLMRLEGWFSESFSTVKNIANGWILLTLFTASVQVFNALLPEQGMPFWIFAFCFFWTLWNNLFAEFNPKRLLQSLGGLFGLAFVVKYLILANLAAPTAGSWWQGILQNPTKEAFTWLLDLPKFAPATGYIQFFTLIFYLIGLFLIKPEMGKNN
ncbi:MAG TPA: hypothetical protein VK400_00145 [Pyrinomonadaceae bacterium]|nr:hypothetical protein [Pyrinomonadaceae bacterium]